MTNFDEHIQNLQRQTGDLSNKIATITTSNADLKNKLTEMETLLANQKTTTVIAPNNTATPLAPPQPTVVQAPQNSGGKMKQLLMMLLMSMMQSQASPVATNPYASVLGSGLQPSNPLLGANPSFGNSSLLNLNALTSSFAPQASQFNAYGAYGTSLYGASNPLQL